MRDENASTGSMIGPEQARQGVRNWVREAGRAPARMLRSASPYGILAFLTASAVAPIAGAGLGASGVFAAVLGQLGNIGGGHLANVLSYAARRMHAERPDSRRRGSGLWRDAIAEALLPRLEAQDHEARALREEIGELLHAVDAVGVALAESTHADDELRESLARAFGALGNDVAELRWMATDAARALATIQRDLTEHGRAQRQQIDLIRQSLMVTTLLRQDLLRGTPADGPDAPAGSPSASDGGCPYPGLASFQPEDAAFFHGRERLVAQLLGRLAEQRGGGPALVVVGVSGAGKSSLLRAGLLPAVATGGLGEGTAGWPWLLLTPGAAPLAELVGRTAALCGADPVTALARVRADPESFGALAARVADASDSGHALGGDLGARPVIVVDQFEELFTQCADQAERSAFATALAHAAPALVVLAVRADFYSHCTALPPMAPMLATGQVVIGALETDELRRAVLVPARRAGLTVEPGLVELLLTDLGALTGTTYEPGALPLLGHALRATWQRRDGDTLTVAGYRRTGGIRHAVADTAERIYLELSGDDRAALRAALLSLVTVADNRGVTRRRVHLDEVDVAVLRRLVDARLVTAGRNTVEISHEALLTSWPRLAGWLSEAREEILLRQRLAEAARDWAESGGDPDALYRGARLAAAREWSAGRGDLPADQAHFLAASVAAAEATELARQRAARRLRRLVAGLAVALLLAVAGGLVAVDQRARAQTQRVTAETQSRVAQSRQYAAESRIAGENDQVESMRRALDAWEQAPTVEARGALLSAQMTNTVGQLGTDVGGYASAVSPNGRLIAVGDAGGRIRLWDATELTLVGEEMRQSAEKPVFSLAFSPDGRHLASSSLETNALKVWEIPGGRLVRTLPGIGEVGWQPGSDLLLANFIDEESGGPALGGWDPVTGQRRLSIASGDVIGFSLAVSPDGRYAAMASDAGAGVWRLSDGARMVTVDDAEIVQFAPDGNVITNDKQGRMRLWEVHGGRLVRTLTDEAVALTRFAVIPEGAVLVNGSDPLTIDAIRLADGSRTRVFTGAPDTVTNIAVSPDGKRVVVTALDGPTTVYRRATDWLSHDGTLHALAATADGRRLATAVIDGPVLIWDLDDRTLLRTLPRSADSTGLAYGPDGTLAATFTDGTVQLWGPDGEPAGTLPPSGDGIADDPVFSPDGALLAVTHEPGSGPRTERVVDPDVVVWEVATGRQRAALRTGDLNATALAFTPDGTRLVAGAYETRIEENVSRQRAALKIWRTSDLSEISRHEIGQYQVVDLDISPDGTMIAVTGSSRRVELYDLDGRRVDADFAGHATTTRGIAFSPDGATVAVTSSGDQLVRLWAVRSGELTAQLAGHVSDVNALAFSPDGGYLYTASHDSTVALWQLDPDTAVERLCGIVGPASRAEDAPVPASCL